MNLKKVSQNNRTQEQPDSFQNWVVFTHISKETKFITNIFKTNHKVAYNTQLP